LIGFGRIAASKIGKGRSRPETQGYFRPSLTHWHYVVGASLLTITGNGGRDQSTSILRKLQR
jgi:hypothetical protein